MRIERFDDKGLEVYFLAVEVWDGNSQRIAGAFKVGEPPGVIGGEFVKNNDGRLAFFNAEQYAIDAAKALYESKK